MRKILCTILTAAILPATAWSLPIDWHGVFGVDTTLIDSYRRIKSTTDNSGLNNGTQEVPFATGNQANASFQSYVFRLSPTIIVNDSASLKGELTTNYGRGGRFGDNTTRAKPGAQDQAFGSSLYVHNNSEGEEILINQLYAELYSDAATWQLGRHSYEWGLGAVYNAGNDTWDRFASARDGVTAKIKIGNFQFTPYWAKIEQDDHTRASRVREMGASVLYDNIERDLAFGILYGKKENSSQAASVTGDPNGDGTFTALGATDVTITDLYLAKKFGDLALAVEVPIMSGEIGNFFENGSVTKYKSKAIILESSYAFSESWKVTFNGGQVSGQAPGSNDFEAMYLHPNYQVANLLFRYDLRGISGNQNIYESYINNATYLKLGTEYTSGKWTWNAAVVHAKADQTAEVGKTSYNHQTGKTFTAQTAQSDDLGTEIDLGFKYRWNNEVHVEGSGGYLLTGDYFAYTNDPNVKNETENSFVLQLRTSLEF